MTPTEAKELANLEYKLYNEYLAADAAWVYRYDPVQCAARREAHSAWYEANEKLLKAMQDYPALFAQFSAVMVTLQ